MVNISDPRPNKLPIEFYCPVFDGHFWKVYEQLQPQNRGFKWHKFESEAEAWRFYESK